MKWIEIQKAKPKFDQLYLLDRKPEPVLVHLHSLTRDCAVFQDADGNLYGGEGQLAGTHLAIVKSNNNE